MIFEGKTALITGASAGIGREFAWQLHSAGARVLLAARRKERLLELCQELNAQRQASALALTVDLLQQRRASTDEVWGITELLDHLQSEQVDILVNNAGRGSFGRFQQLDLSTESEIMRLNVEAPLRLIHALLPGMCERKKGLIINVSSVAGFQPLPFMATYSASKAALYSHSLALASELRGSGVHVIAVCPGPVQTEFSEVAAMPQGMSNGGGDPIQAVVRQSLRAAKKGKSKVVSWCTSEGHVTTHLALTRCRLYSDRWQISQALRQEVISNKK